MLALERRDGRPLCIGHRGAPALAPENTIRSFRAAVQAGADLVEFDVLELGTGQLVVGHSDDLREVSHGAASGTVVDQTLAALREAAPQLPTFEDALAFFADEAAQTGAHVDLKTPGSEEKMLAALRRFRMIERTLVSSFHAAALHRLSRLEPGLRLGISFPRDRLRISDRRGSAPVIRLGLRGLRPVTPAFARALLARSGASALVLHHALVGERAVRVAHGRGAPVVAWTVEDARELARLDEAGVDAVVVDDPTLFASTLQA